MHYGLTNLIGSGSGGVNVDPVSSAACATVAAYSQCNVKIIVESGAVAGSLGFSVNNSTSLLSKLSQLAKATPAVLQIGIEQAAYNSLSGADGITLSYYHTVINGTPYILVSGLVASSNVGSFNKIVLVDSNGNEIPSQMLVGDTVNNTQGTTFSVLLPIPTGNNISQTIKVQTQQVASGHTTVISTATSSSTLSTQANIGIAEMLPSAVYLTSANPEQIITFSNIGDVTAQLQQLVSNNPNVEVVFNPVSLNSGTMTTAILRLKNTAVSATTGNIVLKYNNGQSETVTSGTVDQNINPTPSPSPAPTPTPGPTPPSPPPPPPTPLAGLTAVFSLDNDFFTSTAVGTVSRQLTLTNSGNTTEDNIILTLPANFTIGAGNSNSCTVIQNNSPATINDNLVAQTGSCNITVTYNNNALTAENTEDITISYNYDNGIPAPVPTEETVNYRVTQSTAVLSLTNPWSPYNFINIASDNTDFATQAFTLYNSGEVDATNVAGSINPASIFTILGNYGSTIAAGTSGDLSLKFGPSSTLGANATTLTVNYEDYPTHAATPVTVNITGSVSNAIAYLKTVGATGFSGGTGQSAATAFALQTGSSGQITLTYENKGNEGATNFKLTTGTISSKLTGTPFTLVTDGCNLDSGGMTLSQGQTCDEVLQYSPTTTGATTLPLNTTSWEYSYSDAHGNYTYNSAPVYFNAYSLAITTIPNSGAENVSPSLNQFTINFSSNDMVNSSVNTNNVSLVSNGGSQNILASCASSEGNTYICTTSTGLIPNTTYNFQGVNLLTTNGNLLNFTSSFTTANVTKYAYIGSFNGGVYKCLINNVTGALSGCIKEQSSINQVEAVFIFNGKAYVSSGAANAIYLCQIDSSTGSLSSCNQTGSNFSQPRGVIVSGSTAYVANSGNSSVTKCTLSDNGTLSGCTNAGVIAINDPQDLTINNNYLLIASNGNSTIVTCSLDSITGLATSCYTNNNPPSKGYQDVMIANGVGYITANGYLASCSYINISGTLTSCINASAPGSSNEGLSIYNNNIYISSFDGAIRWCSLNLDGTISANCSSLTGMGNLTGMSIN